MQHNNKYEQKRNDKQQIKSCCYEPVSNASVNEMFSWVPVVLYLRSRCFRITGRKRVLSTIRCRVRCLRSFPNRNLQRPVRLVLLLDERPSSQYLKFADMPIVKFGEAVNWCCHWGPPQLK